MFTYPVGLLSPKVGEVDLNFITYLQNMTKTGTTYQVDNVSSYGRAISDETFSGDFEIIWDMLDPFVAGYNDTFGLTDNTILDNNTVLSILRSSIVMFSVYINSVTFISSFPYIFGDRVKFKRIGTIITVEVFNSGSWTIGHTYTASYSQTFRFKYRDYGNGIKQPILYNPKYLN